MPTVYANSRGVSHRGSGGQSPIFPDVCMTPTPGESVQILHLNIGQLSNMSSGPTSVKTEGRMPMTKSTKYMMSTGDEAGSAMDVVSNKIKGTCEYMMYSFDVKFEGKDVCRLTETFFGRSFVSQRQE